MVYSKTKAKTGQESIIPLLPAAMRIVAKYSHSKSIADFNWQVSTNQKMNLGLKYIGKRAGIFKALYIHLAGTLLPPLLHLPMEFQLKQSAKCWGMPVLNKHSIMQKLFL